MAAEAAAQSHDVEENKDDVNTTHSQRYRPYPFRQNQHIACNGNEDCEILERVIEGLQKYYIFAMGEGGYLEESQQNQSLENLFYEYYKSITDDYIHIITKHSSITDPGKHGFACSADNCEIKHNFNQGVTKSNNISNIEDEEFVVYRDLMNSLHCFLLHPDQIHDHSRQGRFHVLSHSTDQTMIDAISNKLNRKEKDNVEFQEFIEKEEYDTESLEYDVGFKAMDDNIVSNIEKHLGKETASVARECFYFSKCM